MLSYGNFKNNSIFPKNVSLILGFFDGIHAGHLEVINNSPKNSEKVIVTFSESPAEYFNKKNSYIYTRANNYKLLELSGVNYIFEQEFPDIINLSADNYLEMLIEKFSPISITTGFNHTFGKNRVGNAEFLKNTKKSFKYFYTPARIIDDKVVSSSNIKEFLKIGDLELASKFLTRNFSIESRVIKGQQLGRKLGFPTANLKYPENIIKIPYGVYKVKVFDLPAVLNWGVKPTLDSKEELLEVHIPDFNNDLYGQNIEIEILAKIREEIKFENLESLVEQIKKDIEICLKL